MAARNAFNNGSVPGVDESQAIAGVRKCCAVQIRGKIRTAAAVLPETKARREIRGHMRRPNSDLIDFNVTSLRAPRAAMPPLPRPAG
jgi:hypothetical protein